MKHTARILSLAFSAVVFVITASSSASPQDCSPQAIRQERVKLYLTNAREPLGRLASQVYLFAADSERCRLNHGAKLCGLPDTPLNSTDLGAIFDYYVSRPVDAVLNQRQIKAHKSDWIWQPYVKQH